MNVYILKIKESEQIFALNYYTKYNSKNWFESFSS